MSHWEREWGMWRDDQVQDSHGRTTGLRDCNACSISRDGALHTEYYTPSMMHAYLPSRRPHPGHMDCLDHWSGGEGLLSLLPPTSYDRAPMKRWTGPHPPPNLDPSWHFFHFEMYTEPHRLFHSSDTDVDIEILCIIAWSQTVPCAF